MCFASPNGQMNVVSARTWHGLAVSAIQMEERFMVRTHIVSNRLRNNNKLPRSGLLASAVVALALVAAGCGNSGEDVGAATGTTQPSETASNSTDGNEAAKLRSQLPEPYKSSGTIRVEYSDYPPFVGVPESGDSSKPEGFVAEIFNEVSDLLGLKPEWDVVNFNQFAPNLTTGRYDVMAAALYDTKERQEVVDLVDFMWDATGLVVQAGNPRGVKPNEYCGLSISSTAGTVFPTKELPAASKKCESEGKKPVNILAVPSSPVALQLVSSGRADGSVNGAVVMAYAAKQSNGKLELAGEPYNKILQAWGIQKDSKLTPVIRDALQVLINNGKYAEILEDWGIHVDDLGVECSTINNDESRKSTLCQ